LGYLLHSLFVLIGPRAAISAGCELPAIAIIVDSLDQAINPAEAQGFFHGLFIAKHRSASVLPVEKQPNAVFFLVVVFGQPLPPLASRLKVELLHAERRWLVARHPRRNKRKQVRVGAPTGAAWFSFVFLSIVSIPVATLAAK
jgi:hypothetical protein